MEAVLLVIHLIVAIGIIVTILVQPSEAGGFMGNTGSMSNLMNQRRSGDVLTKATTILAGIFFLTSLLLAISAANRPVAKGILDFTDDTKKVEKKVDAGPDAPVAGEKPVDHDATVVPSEEKNETPAPAPAPAPQPEHKKPGKKQK